MFLVTIIDCVVASYFADYPNPTGRVNLESTISYQTAEVLASPWTFSFLDFDVTGAAGCESNFV